VFLVGGETTQKPLKQAPGFIENQPMADQQQRENLLAARPQKTYSEEKKYPTKSEEGTAIRNTLAGIAAACGEKVPASAMKDPVTMRSKDGKSFVFGAEAYFDNKKEKGYIIAETSTGQKEVACGILSSESKELKRYYRYNDGESKINVWTASQQSVA
jgi:hypothetical protein